MDGEDEGRREKKKKGHGKRSWNIDGAHTYVCIHISCAPRVRPRKRSRDGGWEYRERDGGGVRRT